MSPPLLRAPQLEALGCVRHGFSNREGGVSEGPYATCNVGLAVGDERPRVLANRGRLVQALGCGDAPFIALRQAHTDLVVEVTGRAGQHIEADGLWTRAPSTVIAALGADCLPILLAHRGGRAVAAVHAGWRGTAANIAGVMLRRLEAAGIAADEVVAALGPAIGPCCFEVGREVVQALAAVVEVAAATRPSTRPERFYVDLWAINSALLVAGGVAPACIDALRVCTYCGDGLFSFRRDGQCGRQAGMIALKN